jgi:hypothetical protein
MGELCLLYLLCMLPFPVPLTSLQDVAVAASEGMQKNISNPVCSLPCGLSKCSC